jgi:hypothetical protein
LWAVGHNAERLCENSRFGAVIGGGWLADGISG